MILEKSKNKIEISVDDDFNVVQTLECGQVFSFLKVADNSYIVISGNKVAIVTYNNSKIVIESEDINYFYNYFDLDTNYTDIKQKINEINPQVSKYMGYGGGIRILKQNVYQTIISFIVSANNNIKRIKNILFSISAKFGTKIENYSKFLLEEGSVLSNNKSVAFENLEIYSFPTLEQLSTATVEDFSKLGAGYRSEYLVKSIKMLSSKEFSLDNLQKLSTPDLKLKLQTLAGVGPKVADCILLFGFSRTDVFPIDTWTRKCYYLFETKKLNDNEISKYFVDIYKNYSGYAQQYLYNYMLNFSSKN